MKINEIRKLQITELEILKETDRICKKLGIKYYLIGGTLLGAVRHKGFIPWDIDIDIAMLRKDYEAFRLYWLENKSDEFFYQDYMTEKNHISFHAILKLNDTVVTKRREQKEKYKAKHNGIYMDIFPLDYAPDNKRKQKWQQNKIKLCSKLIEAKLCNNYGTGNFKYIAKKILAFLLSGVSFVKIQKSVEKCMTKYNKEDAKYLVSMASHYSYKKQLMEKEIYGEPVLLEYEGGLFYAPADFDRYLTQLYGDYMELPPEDNRYDLIDIVVSVDYGKYNNLEEYK